MKSPWLLALTLAAASTLAGTHILAQANIVPNPQFTGANPLQGWRTAFPWEAFFKENAQYVKVAPAAGGGGNCAQLDIPVDLARNQGAKIESDFIKVEPGATYHAQVEFYTTGLDPKIYAEVWAVDPRPTVPPTKYEVPAQNGLPPLVTVWRAQMPDPPAPKETWKVSGREFTVPAKMKAGGQDAVPLYITFKALGTGPEAGRICFRNFQLLKKSSGH